MADASSSPPTPASTVAAKPSNAELLARRNLGSGGTAAPGKMAPPHETKMVKK